MTSFFDRSCIPSHHIVLVLSLFGVFGVMVVDGFIATDEPYHVHRSLSFARDPGLCTLYVLSTQWPA